MKPAWVERSLGEICEIYQPKTITKEEMSPDGDFPVFGANGVIGRYHKYNHEKPQLLVGCRGACGAVNVSEPNSWITGNAMVIRPRDGTVSARFLEYFFRQANILDGAISGTAQPQITRKSLAPIPLLMPPVQEQEQITAILDDAWSALKEAQERTATNVEDALELLGNLINSLMEGISTSQTRTLGDVCSFENGDRGKNYPGRKAFVSSGVPFINAGHLQDGSIDWDSMNYIPAEHFERLSNGKVRQGDVLFCLRGSLGKFGVVDTDEVGAIASSLVIVRPGSEILTGYLAVYFQSARCAEMIRTFENGAAQPNLSARSLASFEIDLPPISDQHQVIAAVSEAQETVSQIVASYQANAEDLNQLRQSLLARAFAGELV